MFTCIQEDEKYGYLMIPFVEDEEEEEKEMKKTKMRMVLLLQEAKIECNT